MNRVWTVGAALGAVGLVMGPLTLTGQPPAALEGPTWGVIALGVWLPLAYRLVPAAASRTLLWAGFVSGVTTGAVQGLFAATLIANNANYGEPGLVADAGLQWFFFAAAVGLGTATGAVAAALGALGSWLRRAWSARRRGAAA